MPGAEPARVAMLEWMFRMLGLFYGILLPLAGLVSFLLVLILLLRGKGPMAAASLVLIVHIPLLIGLFAAIEGGIQTCTVIHGVAPTATEFAFGISTSLVAPLVGMLVMVPSYLAAVIGTFIRAVRSESE
jgi:hypothetical protein